LEVRYTPRSESDAFRLTILVLDEEDTAETMRFRELGCVVVHLFELWEDVYYLCVWLKSRLSNLAGRIRFNKIGSSDVETPRP